MIKWEHSVFCASICILWGYARGEWLARALADSLDHSFAMVSARASSDGFSIDWRMPRLMPRIRAPGPAPCLRACSHGQFVLLFIVACCGIFVLAAAMLNRLTLALSPVALGVVLLYSYTSVSPRWSHLVLGFALGIAADGSVDCGAGLARSAHFASHRCGDVLVGGFDVLYACQDCEFDTSFGLHSLPRSYGIPKALLLARLMHGFMLVLLVAFVVAFGLGKLAVIGVIAVAALLAYEHSLVSARDLSRLNAAFFTMNGIISVVLFVFVAADLLVRPLPVESHFHLSGVQSWQTANQVVRRCASPSIPAAHSLTVSGLRTASCGR